MTALELFEPMGSILVEVASSVGMQVVADYVISYSHAVQCILQHGLDCGIKPVLDIRHCSLL